MKTIIFFLLDFLDFWFLPFFISLVVSIIVEQVARYRKNFAEKDIEIAMRVRKFLWRQNILLNFSWFLLYFVASFLFRTPQTQLPDMIWKG